MEKIYYRVREGAVLPHNGELLQAGTIVSDLSERVVGDHAVAALVDRMASPTERLEALQADRTQAAADTAKRLEELDTQIVAVKAEIVAAEKAEAERKAAEELAAAEAVKAAEAAAAEVATAAAAPATGPETPPVDTPAAPSKPRQGKASPPAPASPANAGQ